MQKVSYIAILIAAFSMASFSANAKNDKNDKLPNQDVVNLVKSDASKISQTIIVGRAVGAGENAVRCKGKKEVCAIGTVIGADPSTLLHRIEVPEYNIDVLAESYTLSEWTYEPPNEPDYSGWYRLLQWVPYSE